MVHKPKQVHVDYHLGNNAETETRVGYASKASSVEWLLDHPAHSEPPPIVLNSRINVEDNIHSDNKQR